MFSGLRTEDSGYILKQGDIIFFDWTANGNTGTADHVGIVEKVDGNTIYTVEGNSGDECKERQYSIEDMEVLGFLVVLCPKDIIPPKKFCIKRTDRLRHSV